MNFKGKLERLCARMDSNFVDYQPCRGVWIFQVEHFSKYGFVSFFEKIFKYFFIC